MTEVQQPSNQELVVGLFAQFFECILYGMHLITLGSWARVMVSRRKSRGTVNWYLVAVVLCMFALGTLDVVVGVYQIVINTISSHGGPAPPAFLNTLDWTNQAPNVIRFICLIAEAIVGDGVLLYRCYVIWGRQWKVVVFPAVVWISQIACWIANIYYWFEKSDLGLKTKYTKPFIISSLIFTLTFNLVTTSLLVYAILRVHKLTKSLVSSSQGSELSHVSRVIIESGLAYTSCILILFIVFCTDGDVIVIPFASIIQITGIVFTLLIIRIDAELVRRNNTLPSSSFSNSGRCSELTPVTDSQSAIYDHGRAQKSIELKYSRSGQLFPPIPIDFNIYKEAEMNVADLRHYVP